MTSILSVPQSIVVALLAGFGRGCMAFSRHVGQISVLIVRIVMAIFQGGVSIRMVFAPAYEQGIGSLPLVLVTAVLSGIVTSQQGGYQFSSSVPRYVFGSVVTWSVGH